MSLLTVFKRHVLGRILYRHPPIGMQPERLFRWLQALDETRKVPGAVLEIGCSVGGTAAFSWRFLHRTGTPRRYVCIDTFSGFVPEQFEADLALGNDPAHRHMFDGNSKNLARWVLRHHGAPEVELIEGDILTLDPARIPSPIAAALVDVDLAEPVRVALERVWPRLAPGGVILVDDCAEDEAWQAREGLSAFCAAHDLAVSVTNGMGVIRAPRRSGTSDDAPG